MNLKLVEQEMDVKSCAQCGEIKPVSEFYKSSKNTWSKEPYRNICKICWTGKTFLFCVICGDKWLPSNGGQAKRNGSRCDKCYPFYRQAEKLWASAQNRANHKQLQFDLDVEFIEECLKSACPKTGFKFTILQSGQNYRTRHPNSPSIDKIDASRGYTKDNIQVVSWIYNVSKQQFTDQDVLEFCKAVVNKSLDLTVNAQIAAVVTL